MSLSPTYSPCVPAVQHRTLLSRLSDAVVRPLALRRARARLRDELAGLDHRERKDIGISDLDTFVAGWRPDQRD